MDNSKKDLKRLKALEKAAELVHRVWVDGKKAMYQDGDFKITVYMTNAPVKYEHQGIRIDIQDLEPREVPVD